MGAVTHPVEYLRSLVDRALESGVITAEKAEELKSLSGHKLAREFKGMVSGRAKKSVGWISATRDKAGRIKYIFNELSPKEKSSYIVNQWKKGLGGRAKVAITKDLKSLGRRVEQIRVNYQKGAVSYETLENAENAYRSLSNLKATNAGQIKGEISRILKTLKGEVFGKSTEKRDYYRLAKIFGVDFDKNIIKTDPEYRTDAGKNLRTAVTHKITNFGRQKIAVHDLITANAEILESRGVNIEELRNRVDSYHKEVKPKKLNSLWRDELQTKHGLRKPEWFLNTKLGLAGHAGNRIDSLLRRAEKKGLYKAGNLTQLQLEQLRALAMYSILSPGSNMDHIMPLLHKGSSEPLNIDIIYEIENMRKQGNPDYVTKSLLPEDVAYGEGSKRKVNLDKIFAAVNEKIRNFRDVEIPKLIKRGVIPKETASLIQIGEWGSNPNMATPDDATHLFARKDIAGKDVRGGRFGQSRHLKGGLGVASLAAVLSGTFLSILSPESKAGQFATKALEWAEPVIDPLGMMLRPEYGTGRWSKTPESVRFQGPGALKGTEPNIWGYEDMPEEHAEWLKSQGTIPLADQLSPYYKEWRKKPYDVSGLLDPTHRSPGRKY